MVAHELFPCLSEGPMSKVMALARAAQLLQWDEVRRLLRAGLRPSLPQLARDPGLRIQLPHILQVVSRPHELQK